MRDEIILKMPKFVFIMEIGLEMLSPFGYYMIDVHHIN